MTTLTQSPGPNLSSLGSIASVSVSAVQDEAAHEAPGMLRDMLNPGGRVDHRRHAVVGIAHGIGRRRAVVGIPAAPVPNVVLRHPSGHALQREHDIEHGLVTVSLAAARLPRASL